MTKRALGYAGALACWAYALCWVILWWSPDALPPVVRVFEPIVSGRSHARISALVAGGLLFVAAPFVREETRLKRFFFALAIVALVAPGLWLLAGFYLDRYPIATRPTVTWSEAVLWLLLPLGIAAWVGAGTRAPIWPER
jgi:hypothetical protein